MAESAASVHYVGVDGLPGRHIAKGELTTYCGLSDPYPPNEGEPVCSACEDAANAARVRELRDQRDPQQLGAALLKLRERAPKAPLSKLYDRHKAKLEE